MGSGEDSGPVSGDVCTRSAPAGAGVGEGGVDTVWCGTKSNINEVHHVVR